MHPRWQSLLCVLVGVVLIANGLYLFPGNVTYEEEYRVTAETADWPTGDLGSVTIWRGVTGSLDERAITAYLDDGGAIRTDAWNVSDALEIRADLPPEYVLLDDGYHRRTVTLENDTLVVGMHEVPRERVFRVAAENVSDASPVVRRAIANGTASTTDWLPDGQRLINASGDYYLVDVSGPHRGDLIGLGWREPGRSTVVFLRYVGWLGGLGLVWYGGYRYANLT